MISSLLCACFNLFQIRAQEQQQAINSKRIKREVFPSETCNDICHFVNVRHEFLFNRLTGPWNELTNSQVNAQNINSLKAGLDILPILAAKAYWYQRLVIVEFFESIRLKHFRKKTGFWETSLENSWKIKKGSDSILNLIWLPI